MQKRIKSIVLTGGPCAGKSSAISRIEQELNDVRYKVIIIPEAATEIMNNGIRPHKNLLSDKKFQSILIDYQISREKFYKKIAKEINHEKIIFICDRGVMDGKAYISNSEFEELLCEKKLNEIGLIDRYDAIFHLQTAAIGAEEFYTLENNLVREETKEEAAIIDKELMVAWNGHSHLRIIDNSTDFETKINRLVKEIFNFLGEPVPLKIERKFLIKMPNLEKMIKHENCRKLQIKQTYLISNDPKTEKRIRRRGKDGSYTYYYNISQNISNLVRLKKEEKISHKEYMALKLITDESLNEIEKDRYCFIYNNLYIKLDVYPYWEDTAILEIELTEKNQQFEIASFIDVIREVTNEVSFKNYSIAKQIPVI